MPKVVNKNGVAVKFHSAPIHFTVREWEHLSQIKKKTGQSINEQIRILVERELAVQCLQ